MYLCPVYGDDNCLYRTLSHIIFGSESSYRILKHSLISRFKSTPAHFYNFMRKSGIFSDQELIEHMDRVSVLNEWGNMISTPREWIDKFEERYRVCPKCTPHNIIKKNLRD